MKFNVWFVFLLLFSSVVIFYHLGSNSLHDGDEAKFAFVTKEMIKSGDYITPHIQGEPYFGKPPLRFWLTSVLFRIFGTSEWIIRFWSAAAAVGCVAFTCLIGRKLFGDSPGLWAGFALATSVQFVYEHCAKTGEMDALLLFLTVSSMYCVLKSDENPRFLLIAFTLMGLASLTKNFAGFVPLGISVIYLSIAGKWKRLPLSTILLSFGIFLVVSFVWIIAMIAIHKQAFIQQYIVQQTVRRATSSNFGVGVKEARTLTGGVKFIAQTVLNGFFPWSLILPIALIWSATRFKQWRQEGKLLAFVWFCTFSIAILFFRNKLYWYLLPLYPPACILTAQFIAQIFSEWKLDWKWIFLCVVVLAGSMLLIQDNGYNPFSSRAVESGVSTLSITPLLAKGLIAAALSVLIALLIPRVHSIGLLQGALIVSATLFVALPLLNSDHKSQINELSLSVEKHALNSRNTLYLWSIPKDVFYPSYPVWKPGNIARWYMNNISRTRLEFLGKSDDVLAQLLKEGGSKLFLMPEPAYEEIKSLYAHHVLEVRTVNGRGYVLISPL